MTNAGLLSQTGLFPPFELYEYFCPALDCLRKAHLSLSKKVVAYELENSVV